MLGINAPELLIIAIVAVLVIGPARLPEYAEKLRNLIRELRRMASGARDTIKEIGYIHPEIGFDAQSCGVLTAIHSQSPDIARGVDKAEDNDREQGAGDQAEVDPEGPQAGDGAHGRGRGCAYSARVQSQDR